MLKSFIALSIDLDIVGALIFSVVFFSILSAILWQNTKGLLKSSVRKTYEKYMDYITQKQKEWSNFNMKTSAAKATFFLTLNVISRIMNSACVIKCLSFPEYMFIKSKNRKDRCLSYVDIFNEANGICKVETK